METPSLAVLLLQWAQIFDLPPALGLEPEQMMLVLGELCWQW